MTGRLASLAALVALTTWSSRALAEPKNEARSYGEQVIIADLGALAFAGVGAGWALEVLWALSWPTLVSGPIVHLAHGRPVVALGSFALRVGAIGLGAALGVGLTVNSSKSCTATFSSNGSSSCPTNWETVEGWAFAGAGVGFLVASVVDALLLAHEPVHRSAGSELSFSLGAGRAALSGSF